MKGITGLKEKLASEEKGQARKKIIVSGVLFLIFTLMLPTILPTVKATTPEEASITVSRIYETSRRNEFAVDVYLHNPTGMANGMLDLSFDEDVLDVRSDLVWGEVLEDFFMTTENIKPGVLHVNWADSTDSYQSGLLFSLQFRLRTSNAVSDLELSRVELNNAAGENIPVKELDGRVAGFTGKIWERDQNQDQNQDQDNLVARDKDWSIDFSTPVNPATVNPLTFKVTPAGGGPRVPGEISFANNNRTINFEPLEHYEPGEYILTITEQMSSRGGVSLQEAIRFQFEVE